MFTLRKSLLAAFMMAVAGVAFTPPSQAAYSQRKQITIDHTRVGGSASLSNFPVLVRIQNDADLRTIANGGQVVSSAGDDIIFTGSDGVTQLDHELESYDGATGTLFAWVRVPTLSPSSDTVFYMDFGNSSVAGPTEDPGNVWDSNYVGVWHLVENQSGTGTTDLYKDSTSYSNHGDDYVSATGKTGKIASGQQFDGSNDYAGMGNVLNYGKNDPMTYSAWIKTSGGSFQIAGKAYHTGTYYGVWFFLEDSSLSFWLYDSAGNYKYRMSTKTFTDNQWHHVAATYDGSNSVNGITLYGDGSQLNISWSRNDSLGTVKNSYPFNIGAANNGAGYRFNGYIDEVRLSNTRRSPAWIETEFNNGMYPNKAEDATNGFLSVGAVQVVDDHGDDCNTATLVPCNSITQGELEESTDIDYFRLDVTGPGNLTIYSEGSELNAWGALLNGDCTQIATDDDSGEGTNFRIEHTVALPDVGTYYIAVRSHDSGHTGTYTLKVECDLSVTITASAASGGTIDPSGEQTYSTGATPSFTIQPLAEYWIEEVQVDGVPLEGVQGISTPYIYTFDPLVSSHTIAATFARPSYADCKAISDVPLSVGIRGAPANIMFLLDDSCSMDSEIMIPGKIDGAYEDWYMYAFDDPGDHQWDGDPATLIRGGNRLHWKTQWYGYNRIYYNPAVTYQPWPTADGGQFPQAQPDNPKSHPMRTYTLNMSGSYDTLSVGEIIVDDEDPEGFTMTGDWDWADDGQAYLEHHYWTPASGNYAAAWRTDLVGGSYTVYVRYASNTTRDHTVPYVVTHASGTTTRWVDQSVNGGTWVSLGTYTFNDGEATVAMSVNVVDASRDSVCADAIKFVPSSAITTDIKRAHYYLWSFQTGKPYLVIVDGGAITYYMVKDDGDNVVEPGELRLESDPPADVVTSREYTAERQNFANWFTYYRRRSLVATYAISKVITSMSGVRIGIRTIHDDNLIQPVVNIKSGGEDDTSTLLNRLWPLYYIGGTPLRTGLEHVGRYFDKDDGFKLDGTSGIDSPYETVENGGACQQSFVIIVSDGGYSDQSLLNTSIGNADGDNGSPYADTWSRTLADIAMYYYERDLATGLDDELGTNPMDDATWQHMVTYGISFGVPGTLEPADYDENLKDADGDYIAWPDPISPGNYAPERIDDLWHATVNGRGSFFNANNPEELVDALLLVMMNIESRVASNAAVSVNGDELYESLSDETLMFQSSYCSDGWSGDVKAFGLDTTTGQVITTSYRWSAADKLETKTWNTRVIATFDGSQAQPFRFDSPGLSDAQKLLLSTDAEEAELMMKYLRGDRSKEEANGGTYRNRFYKLGDIVESSPYFHSGVVYASGNDGMLHAFDAQTGEERFAYIPGLVFENLRYLADPNYTHRFYVNLTPEIEDVSLSGVERALLVGGLGKGGKGYFALDVKNPTSITTETALANRVLWEYPKNATAESERNDMGYSFSEVAIVRSNDVSNEWVVIFGNGYNSVNGHAVLVVLKAADGTVLKAIDTGVGACNGLSSPVAVDVDDDDTVDFVYAGDLKGNLWKFDLTSTGASEWDVAYKDGETKMPLFQAKGATGLPQPITSKPDVMRHCQGDGCIVTFGTGIYLASEDVGSTLPQTIYGIWDYGDSSDTSEYVGSFNRGSTPPLSNPNFPETVSLLEQTEVDWRSVNGHSLRTLSDNTADWETATDEDTDEDPNPVKHVGWYFDLPFSGERVMENVLIRDGNVIIISYTPGASMCGAEGNSIVQEMDACTGGRLTKPQFDINDDGVIDQNDLIEVNGQLVPPTGIHEKGRLQPPAILRLGNVETKYFSSSYGTIRTLKEKGLKLGLIYWMEMEQ